MAVATLARILAQLHGCTQPEPNQWQSRCPAHEETEASFGMAIDPDGRIKLNCFVGCSKDAICAALGITLRDLAPDDSPAGSPRPAPPPSTKISSDELERRCAEWAANLAAHPLAKAKLALLLDLPEEVFDQLPGLGARMDHRDGPCWTFPERDARNRIVGVGLRFRDGKKRVEDDTSRGLTIPAGWQDKPGALYIVEGPSDVLAMTAAGLACIGRPSVAGGVKLLAEFVNAHVPKDRAIYWIGENDQNLKTKKWPGRDESGKACARFAAEVPNPVSFGMVPNADYKDMRSWLTGLVNECVPWGLCGDRVRTFFKPTLVGVVRPEPKKGKGKEVPPPVVDEDDKRDVVHVKVGCDETKVNDQVIASLAKDDTMFVRSGSLVFVAHEDAYTDEDTEIEFTAGPMISTVTVDTLRERITRQVRFTGDGKNDEKKTKTIPDSVPRAVRDRKQWRGIHNLKAVVGFPFIRKDGTLVSEDGYDKLSKVYLHQLGGKPVLPEVIDRDAALKAWEGINDILRDFPFAKEYHRSAWLAGLLTPLARFAFKGPTPLMLIDANTPATGKTKLAHIASLILTRQKLPAMPYSQDEEETRKKMTTVAMKGSAQILLDNINVPFGGATMDILLTSTEWEDRILGGNTFATLSWLTTIWATGNNVQILFDGIRRINHIRLDSKFARPEERTGFKYEDIEDFVHQKQPILLGHALTILMAYFKAGYPKQNLIPWGSYESWSKVVRAAVVWIGLDDPAKGKNKLKMSSDPVAAAMTTLLANWRLFDPSNGGITASKILNTVFPPRGGETPADLVEVAEAIDLLCTQRKGHHLGVRFRQKRNTPFGDWKLVEMSASGGVCRWGVKTVPPECRAKVVEDADNDPESGDGGDGGSSPASPGENGKHPKKAKNQETGGNQVFSDGDRSIPLSPPSQLGKRHNDVLNNDDGLPW